MDCKLLSIKKKQSKVPQHRIIAIEKADLQYRWREFRKAIGISLKVTFKYLNRH